MGNVFIILILIIVIGGAVWGTVRRIRYGSSCCGEHDPAPKKIRVSDRSKKNYPFVYELSVDGMHCGNCARRVENAFNLKEGCWAEADLANRMVTLRSKRSLDEEFCSSIVSGAGYTMLSMKNKKDQEGI